MDSLTNFTSSSSETCKTDKTDGLTNETFLSEVVRGRPTEARLITVSFSGDPAKTPSTSWTGEAWENILEQPDFLPEKNNNYFTLASFRPDDRGSIVNRRDISMHYMQ